MPRLLDRLRRPHRLESRHRSRGQSMVEFALVLPVLLLLLLVAIDFGRIYLGYINLQQVARIAAGFAAEHASAWVTPEDAAVLARYQDMVENDATTMNCDLVEEDGGFPQPVFIDDGRIGLGNRVEVRINCRFGVLTPIISTILGNAVDLTAHVVYPIREGAVAEVPGGGEGVFIQPVADFVATPLSGYQSLVVTFTDVSSGSPSSWEWDFGDGTSSFDQGPHTITYDCPPGVLPSCDFTVSLTVGGRGGFDTATKTVTVFVPPDTGPIAEFVGDPLSGEAPLTVDFDFVDLRALDADATNDVVYTGFEWDFGDGQTSNLQEPPDHPYAQPGTYDVWLRVTDDAGVSHDILKRAYVIVARRLCTVPDFGGVRVSDAQAVWDAANFTTTVTALPPPPRGQADYRIHYQSIVGGVIDPQPDGCDSSITVGP